VKDMAQSGGSGISLSLLAGEELELLGRGVDQPFFPCDIGILALETHVLVALRIKMLKYRPMIPKQTQRYIYRVLDIYAGSVDIYTAIILGGFQAPL
jgi:hypothetical protein